MQLTEGNERNKRIGRIFLHAGLVLLAAQINISLYSPGFLISMGVVPLSIFFFLSSDYPILRVSSLSGFGVFLSRSLLAYFQTGSFDGAWSEHAPEWVFYLVYGSLLYIMGNVSEKKTTPFYYLLPLIAIDYCSNLVELLFHMQGEEFQFGVQRGIILAAFCRFLIIWILIRAFHCYSYSLVKKTDLEQYRRSVLMLSKMQGELFWMEKNTERIESTMREAYDLYHKEKNKDVKLAASSLKIATDIHELKKEYYLILSGMKDAIGEGEEINEPLDSTTLLTLLRDCLVSYERQAGVTLDIELLLQKPYVTKETFALMSVFRNLIANAIEASLAKNPQEPVRIAVSQKAEENGCTSFVVVDWGIGIPKENLTRIFHPGFSSKINYKTGEVSRGLGLSLAETIVKDHFGGRITAESDGSTTSFTIVLPLDKEAQRANLSVG